MQTVPPEIPLRVHPNTPFQVKNSKIFSGMGPNLLG